MKLTSTLLLVLISILAFAQKEAVFKFNYAPNKTYQNSMVNTTDMEMDMAGSEEVMAQLKASGMAMPMKLLMVQEIGTTIKTSSPDSEGFVPAVLTYDKLDVKQSMNGKEMPGAQDMFKGTTVDLKTKDGKLLFVGVNGQSNQMVADMIKTMVDQMGNSVVFPAKPLKPGNTFDHDVPMSIPMSAGMAMKIVVKSNYKLVKIEKGLGYFDVIQKVTLDMTMDAGTTGAEGEGTGKMIFDIQANMWKEFSSDINMTLLMNMGPMKMTAKSKSQVIQTTVIK